MSAETKGAWTADHLHLARTVVGVRAELRRLPGMIPGDMGIRLGRLACALTRALKARGATGQRCDRGAHQ